MRQTLKKLSVFLLAAALLLHTGVPYTMAAENTATVSAPQLGDHTPADSGDSDSQLSNPGKPDSESLSGEHPNIENPNTEDSGAIIPNAGKPDTENADNTDIEINEYSVSRNAADGAETEEPADSRRTGMRAAVRSSSVDMSIPGFVFANGTPIVIRENSGITSVYDTDGNLLSGSTDISSYSAVYGGWFDTGQHNNSTSVVMESGTITGSIFGGSCGGTLNGNTSVVIEGGTVGWVYGGGANSTVNGTARVEINTGTNIWGQKVGDNSIDTSGTVFGAGTGGSVADTEVIFNGGDAGWIYGGGENCSVENTHVRIFGEPENWSTVFGGGHGGDAQKSMLEIYNVNKYVNFYGGGWEDTVDEAQIIVGDNCNLSNARIYGAGASSSGTSPVGTASFHVSVTNQGQNTTPVFEGLDGSGVTGNVSATFTGSGTISQDYSTQLFEVDDVTVDNCRFNFSGTVGADNKSQIKLNRLELTASGEVTFFAGIDQISLGELAGCGTIYFAKNRSDGDLATVNVDRITATFAQPIRVDKKGPYLTDAIWENFTLFTGEGVRNLESPACFVSARDTYVIDKTDDGSGIIVKKDTGRKQAYITSPFFDQPSYRYGETMNITLGLITGIADGRTPISGERIEIRGGSQGLSTIASTLTDASGQAAFSVPVDDFLWDSRHTGLQAAYWGSEAYKPNFYGVSLDGGGMTFEIKKAEIALNQEIPTPTYREPLPQTLATESDAFYTAQILWTPATGMFLADMDYTADIRLTPKKGYSLNADTVDSISYLGKELSFPVQTEPDGSLILRNIATFRTEQPDATQVQVNDFTQVPEALKHTPFNTVEKIIAELRTKVTAALKSGDNQIVIYDVRLQYLVNNTWKDVDPDDFPPEGVTVILPYPEGTNETDYIFTVQHMISHGPNAGNVETLAYTPIPNQGLQCRFTSLSPVAVGYLTAKEPPSDNNDPSDNDDNGNENNNNDDNNNENDDNDNGNDDNNNGNNNENDNSNESNGGNGGGSESNGGGFDFWQSVRDQIYTAKPGDIIESDSWNYGGIPWTVMKALKEHDGITLVIRRSGAKDLIITSGNAPDYLQDGEYLFTDLEQNGYGFTAAKAAAATAVGTLLQNGNTQTTGVLTTARKVSSSSASASVETPDKSVSRSETAETTEANDGETKESDETQKTEETNEDEETENSVGETNDNTPKTDNGLVPEEIPDQSGENTSPSVILLILILLLASAGAGILVWKKQKDKNSEKQ